jgi:phenylalanyl-tRNA synthetase beta chain
MVLSPDELGLTGEADGIMVLGSDGVSGMNLTDLMPADSILVVEVTSNRPDELCHLGIARELSAVLNRPLKDPAATPRETRDRGAIDVEVADPDLCPRYVARVVDAITVGASPAWVQRRLRSVGQRPINNVVDAANYVLLELGQPLHTFDAGKLNGGIVVRRARTGESLLCLDGKSRALATSDLVIADQEQPHAIAGIIGGAASAVSDTTKTVVIESATFQGINLRATSRRLGIRTEASSRFEKQLHPDLAPAGAARLAFLLQDALGAGSSTQPVDVYPRPFGNRPISCQVGFFGNLLGDDISSDEVEGNLKRLLFKVERRGDEIVATAPPFRLDVQLPVDLVEEVGRLHGHNTLPSTLPGRRTPLERLLPPPDPEWQARDVAMGAGYDEVINFSFATPADAEVGVFPSRRLRIRNPMTVDQEAMRTSLLPGLIRTLARNAAWGSMEARVFEIGRVFWPGDEELPREPRVMGLGVQLRPGGGVREALLHLKGTMQMLVETISGREPEVDQAAVAGLRRGRAAELKIAGELAGCIGELDPDLARRADATGAILLAELNFDLVASEPHVPRFRAVPRYPAVMRDLALTVAESTPAKDVVVAIRELGEGILRSVDLFDEYRGAQVEPGRKGLALHLVYQHEERTLRGEEVNSAHRRIVDGLARGLGARER